MTNEADRYWVALAVDNSIPRPEPDEESGGLPMSFNASPLLKPTEMGEDALCVFSTEGKVVAYLSQAGEEPVTPIVPARPMSLSGRDDFRQFLARYPASHVALDPEYGEEGEIVLLEEFLASL